MMESITCENYHHNGLLTSVVNSKYDEKEYILKIYLEYSAITSPQQRKVIDFAKEKLGNLVKIKNYDFYQSLNDYIILSYVITKPEAIRKTIEIADCWHDMIKKIAVEFNEKLES